MGEKRKIHSRLITHVALLVAMLGLGASWMRLEVPWVGDEGAYALQVQALQQGSWEYDYVGETVDKRGSWFPIMATSGFATTSGNRYFTYVKHPAYPWAQYQLSRIFGDHVALYLLPLAGALLAAIAAWLLMSEVNPHWSKTAFWLTASSPLLVNAFVMWAHAPSAALAGFLTLAVVRISRQGLRPYLVALFALTLILGILLRSEFQLFGGAIILGLVWTILGQSKTSWRHRGLVCLGSLTIPLILILLTRKFEFWIISQIVDTGVAEDGIREGSSGLSYWAGRLPGVWHLLFEGSASGGLSNSLLYIALLATIVAGLALRFRLRICTFVVLFASCLMAVAVWQRFRELPLESIGGLLVAWPILATAAISTRRRNTSRIEQALGITVGVFFLAVLATQYSVAGGLEWGARFLSPLIPLLAVLMAAGLHRLLDARPRIEKGILLSSLGIIAVLPTIFGVRLLHDHKEAKAPLIDSIAATNASLILLTTPLLNELPREAWRLYPNTKWIVAPNGDADQVLKRLYNAGFNKVGVIQTQESFWVQQSDYQKITDVTFPMIAGAGLEMLILEREQQTTQTIEVQ